MIRRFLYRAELAVIVAALVWLAGVENILRGIAEHLLKIVGK